MGSGRIVNTTVGSGATLDTGANKSLGLVGTEVIGIESGGTFGSAANPKTLSIGNFGALNVNSGGTASASQVNVTGGQLNNSGTVNTNVVTVTNGGRLSGSGQFAALPSGSLRIDIGQGGTVSPGNSPGVLTQTGTHTWGGGGNYNFQVANATGASGTAYDRVQVNGVLDIQATSANPFQINLWSLSGTNPDANGNASNFVNTNTYTWTIATATGGITGFSADKFQINKAAANGTGGFTNATGNGSFFVQLSADQLSVEVFFNPVPEPASVLGVAAAGLGLAGWVRRRRVRAAA